MNVWELTITIESPTILTRRRTTSGFAETLTYIPSTTLRGAILTALYREGVIDQQTISREAEVPTIVASPAYPKQGDQILLPAHPFIQRCKLCDKILQSEWADITQLDRLENALRNGALKQLVMVECEKGHRALKSLHPSEFIPEVKDREDKGALYSISVGMSRGRAAGVKGLLYSYEAIKPGAKYWATLASRSRLDLPGNRLTIKIGRGISRGYGSATLEVRGLQPKPYSLPRDGEVLFYALSPLLGNVEAYDLKGTFPRRIDLEAVASRAGIQATGEIKLDPEKVFGRTMWVSAGWDMAKGEPRPQIQCRPPGTVLFGQVSASHGLALTALRYFGTVERIGQHVLAGFNLLIPVGALKDAP